MRSTLILSLALLLSLAIFSCKKKNDQVGGSILSEAVFHSSGFTAKVNGVNWSMAPSDGYFMGKYGGFHEFGGLSSSDPPWSMIAIHFTCSPGTYSFGSNFRFFANYSPVNSTLFTSRTGTMAITEIDTFPSTDGQFLKKIKCTFSFMTDTIGGQSFNITEGKIDFTKPQ
jgi:hypothetical protein